MSLLVKSAMHPTIMILVLAVLSGCSTLQDTGGISHPSTIDSLNQELGKHAFALVEGTPVLNSPALLSPP